MLKSIKSLLLCLSLVLLLAVHAQAFSNQENPAVKGEIVETMDAGGYTYLHLDSGNDMKVWAAIPETKVQVGETVQLTSSMVMQNFIAKALGRTFPAIIFSSGITR